LEAERELGKIEQERAKTRLEVERDRAELERNRAELEMQKSQLRAEAETVQAEAEAERALGEIEQERAKTQQANVDGEYSEGGVLKEQVLGGGGCRTPTAPTEPLASSRAPAFEEVFPENVATLRHLSPNLLEVCELVTPVHLYLCLWPTDKHEPAGDASAP
jgi:multidrug efflux pump subunit AcrA (membrane-fusion protein)